MSALLPPSTNPQYDGPKVSAGLPTLLALLTIIPGSIHVFLPDGGAGAIAGIDLTTCGPVVIALFAWAGATQIVFGLVMLLVSFRCRSFVPLVLALLLGERTLHALAFWVLKAGTGHHPPEHYAVLVGLPVVAGALGLSLRPRAV